VLRIGSIFPIPYCKHIGISHVLFSLGEQWQQRSALKPWTVVTACDADCRQPYVVEAVSPWLRGYHYRFSNLPKLVEKRFIKELKHLDVTYLWPATSLDLYRTVKAAQKPIFVEHVNCYTGEAKAILDDAYARLGLAPQHSITEQTIQDDRQMFALADFLICPSQRVKESFITAGVPDHKLIQASEGWDPSRFAVPTPRPVRDEVTVLFLGSVCVRKGAHLLLRAWEKAQIKGRLILMGAMEPAIAQTCASQLARPDVTHITFSEDYKSVYQQADIFALPSLEEGSPLVTYEAMGSGLPILASPMGAGGIVRDGIDGHIVPPYDEDAWVEALRSLAANPAQRATLGAAARQQSLEYTWDKVAARRCDAMLAKLQATPPSATGGVATGGVATQTSYA
jgi:glycosyltransferase involved in cell wall biosynthesis